MTFHLTDKQKELRNLLVSPAQNVLFYGGSRSGKTFLLCYGIIVRALRAPGSRHAIFRKHGVAAKQSIGKDTLPKVVELAFPELRLKWYEQDGYFLLPNGSEIWVSGLDDKERVDKVLGKEYCTVYLNEASEIAYSSYLTVRTRLAQRVNVAHGEGVGQPLPLKFYVDLNPTTQSHWTFKTFVQGIEPDSKQPLPREQYVFGIANPNDNAENLDVAYIESLKFLPKPQRARFFEGIFTGDSVDALWQRESIDRLFVQNDTDLPDFKRIVVSIDPAISTEAGSNETGIIVAATDSKGMGYVLADGSGNMKPQEWAKKAVTLYHYYHADLIVAEANQGGDMVAATIEAYAPDVPVKLVKATRGKYIRAEPVAALYARGRVRHVGEFEELEDQMCSFKADFDRKAEGYSPDRVDALVWAKTELFPGLVQDRKPNIRPQTVAQSEYDPFNVHQSARRVTAQSVAGYDPF